MTELRDTFITDATTGLNATVKANVNTSNNELAVNLEGHQCPENTTTDQLAADAVFTGSDWQDTLDYGVISVNITTDQDSATDGLDIQWSNNGTDVKDHDYFTVNANVSKTFTFGPAQRYYRIVYTNGSGGTTTTLNISSIMRKTYVKPSSHRIADSIVADDDAELMKSVITGETPTGIFKNVQVTADGFLTVSNLSSGLDIAKGNVSGTTYVHKFGKAPDFDISDGEVTVWDGADDTGLNAMAYTYSTTADIDSLVSSSAADTQSVEVTGLDTNWDLVTQTITLTGQTRVALTTSLIRVFRVINRGATSNAGSVYCYVNSTITAGVPDDNTKVRAIIRVGKNQTLMALYTVPNGKKGYMRDWYASLSKKKTSACSISLFARPVGEVFQIKHVADIRSDGTSFIQHKYEEPEQFAAKTDIVIRADTSADANGVSAGFDLVLVDD